MLRFFERIALASHLWGSKNLGIIQKSRYASVGARYVKDVDVEGMDELWLGSGRAKG
jgi:hypothetical protein